MRARTDSGTYRRTTHRRACAADPRPGTTDGGSQADDCTRTHHCTRTHYGTDRSAGGGCIQSGSHPAECGQRFVLQPEHV